jgi:hypothetical protein
MKSESKSKFAVSLDQLLEAVERDENVGFCVVCGAEAYGVEPDARAFPCEECRARGVYGAEELLFRLYA